MVRRKPIAKPENWVIICPDGSEHRADRCQFRKRSCEVEGCDVERHWLGYCQPHATRFKKYGDPLATPTLSGRRLTNEERKAREKLAHDLYREGLSFREVGQRIGQVRAPEHPLSASRTAQLVDIHARRVSWEKYPDDHQKRFDWMVAYRENLRARSAAARKARREVMR